MLAPTSTGNAPVFSLPAPSKQAPEVGNLVEEVVDKENQMNTMGSRIKARRLELRLSQKQLAQKVGVTRQTVSAWEHGTSRDITGVHLEALGRALTVATRWIVTGDRQSGTIDYGKNGGEISEKQKVLMDQILRLTDDEVEQTLAFVSRLEEEQRELYEKLRARFESAAKKH